MHLNRDPPDLVGKVLGKLALTDRAKAPSVTITCEAMTYNKDQWISSFEDAMVNMTMRILTTIGLTAWNKKGTQGVDPALAALEWSQSMDKSRH